MRSLARSFTCSALTRRTSDTRSDACVRRGLLRVPERVWSRHRLSFLIDEACLNARASSTRRPLGHVREAPLRNGGPEPTARKPCRLPAGHAVGSMQTKKRVSRSNGVAVMVSARPFVATRDRDEQDARTQKKRAASSTTFHRHTFLSRWATHGSATAAQAASARAAADRARRRARSTIDSLA
jgi:hypothetical protein